MGTVLIQPHQAKVEVQETVLHLIVHLRRIPTSQNV